MPRPKSGTNPSKMPGTVPRKRKANDHDAPPVTPPPKKEKQTPKLCPCGKHTIDQACMAITKQAELSMTLRILTFCPTIDIFVGADRRSFTLHRDFLMIHCVKIRELLEAQGPEDNKLILPDVDPDAFAVQVLRLYGQSGFRSPVKVKKPTLCEEWLLADFLQCSTIKNRCMDALRKRVSIDYRDHGKQSPTPSFVERVYQDCPKDSLLRKFVTDCIVSQNPFRNHVEGSEQYEAWKQLLEKYSELGVSIAMASGKVWDEEFPWGEKYRSTYMEKPVDLGLEWASIIRGRQSEEDLKRLAHGGCFRSMIELEHLARFTILE
ncbi:hypothetical protein HYFRA_00010413 [Hymenoscyphus fraxineus]|uniref:BTB domain-containing protein n=1 Tax=Hymenoscyphus fraxineus TaxID=746836 RepID=A0A9N9PXD9_9HELO|nr:hypothetical protein HYFRA_00010413 [Hymenoscyphus fraxineus]